jgi:hypothetical protein
VAARYDAIEKLIRLAGELMAEAEALRSLPPDKDPILTLDEVQERYKVGRTAVLGAVERNELKISRGPRQRIQVRLSEMERWIDACTSVRTDGDGDEERGRQLRAYAAGGGK